MAKIVVEMSMSLDGFITGPDDGPDNGLGTGGDALHAWLGEGGVDPTTYRPNAPVNGAAFDDMLATGAVITGRRTFEHGNEWGGDHHDGVPIFVLTRTPPDRPAPGHARWITDPAEAATLARAAAGDRDIMMHGATAVQAMLRLGEVDEFAIHLVPIVLGSGRRLFAEDDGMRLRLVRSVEGEGVLHLRYAVERA